MNHDIIINILDWASFILVLPEIVSDRTMNAVKSVAEDALARNHDLFERRLHIQNIVNIAGPTVQPYFSIWLASMIILFGAFFYFAFTNHTILAKVFGCIWFAMIFGFALVPGLTKLLFLAVKTVARKRIAFAAGVLMFTVSRGIAIYFAATGPAITGH